jgi:hypothetical protein
MAFSLLPLKKLFFNSSLSLPSNPFDLTSVTCSLSATPRFRKWDETGIKIYLKAYGVIF